MAEAAPSRRLLQLTLGKADDDKASHIADALALDNIQIKTVGVDARGNKFQILRRVFSRAVRFTDYDAVIATEYTLAFAAALRALLTGYQKPIIALGLNLSGRPIGAGLGPINWIINRIFDRLSLIIVYSRAEIEQFKALHDLPKEKFAFAHWGFDLPEQDSARFDRHTPYICMVGRNNRDFAAFCETARRVGVAGILIAPDYADIDEAAAKAANVEIFRDLPFADCLSCIQHARANLILLNDGDRGAGHITAVAGMLLGVPQIYSQASVLDDYFVDQATGLSVPIGDIAACEKAVQRVLTDAAIGKRLSDEARNYAQHWLSHEKTARRQAQLISAVVNGAAFEAVDPSWRQAIGELSSRLEA